MQSPAVPVARTIYPTYIHRTGTLRTNLAAIEEISEYYRKVLHEARLELKLSPFTDATEEERERLLDLKSPKRTWQ
jgi:hypothetical protein